YAGFFVLSHLNAQGPLATALTVARRRESGEVSIPSTYYPLYAGLNLLSLPTSQALSVGFDTRLLDPLEFFAAHRIDLLIGMGGKDISPEYLSSRVSARVHCAVRQASLPAIYGRPDPILDELEGALAAAVIDTHDVMPLMICRSHELLVLSLSG